MQQDHVRFMRMAIEEAAKAGREGNLAVGSVIVRDSSVVARGRNLVNTTFDLTAHAETVALREAGAALRQTDFSGCTLYTTFEPCPMCCGAIMIGGIATLVMGARPQPYQVRWGSYRVERLFQMANWGDNIEVVTGILPSECVDVRRQWEAGYKDRR